ncbi:hypothetical protein ACWC2H_19260 [Streptomyces sp. 900105755]
MAQLARFTHEYGGERLSGVRYARFELPDAEHRLGLWFRDHPEDRREFVTLLLERHGPERPPQTPGAARTPAVTLLIAVKGKGRGRGARMRGPANR